jgi:hypothetical protein
MGVLFQLSKLMLFKKAIRRDGSLHADGRELRGLADARLGVGEEVSLVIDMQSEPRSVTFMRNGDVLGKLNNLPPRVV